MGVFFFFLFFIRQTEDGVASESKFDFSIPRSIQDDGDVIVNVVTVVLVSIVVGAERARTMGLASSRKSK